MCYCLKLSLLGEDFLGFCVLARRIIYNWLAVSHPPHGSQERPLSLSGLHIGLGGHRA